VAFEATERGTAADVHVSSCQMAPGRGRGLTCRAMFVRVQSRFEGVVKPETLAIQPADRCEPVQQQLRHGVNLLQRYELAKASNWWNELRR